MRKIFLCVFILTSNIGFAQLLLNEISSVRGYEDANGKDCDWLEVVNIGNVPINLSNYFLSDKLNNLTKWNFPEEQLDSMEHMLILCSGLDKKNRVRDWQSIINKSSQWSYLLGLSEPDSNWRSILYNDSAWGMGYMGFGFGDNDDSTYISGASSFYLRTQFTVLDTLPINNLILHADYDDAFIAYLNGVEIARSRNIYSKPDYNALATSEHEALIYRNSLHERYVIDNALIDSVLHIGDNVLAIQIHDVDSIPDDISASFFLHAGINSDSTYFNLKTDWFEDTTSFYHTNFKISDSETIFISDSLGNILDQKAISTDRSLISEGRSPSGIGNWCYFNNPSPGISNDSNWCYNGITEEPSVSLPSGWYVNAEHITINVPNNSNVYYTVNGDVPDTNDYKYTDTLWFDKTTVLSVRAFGSNNLLPSKVIDRTYIFNEDNFGLPVFSIITDSLNLWDWNTGIYVLGPNANPNLPYKGANFWQKWSKWSRLEFFDSNRNKQAEEELDLEIHGGYSKVHPQKSFRLDFKSRYSGDLEWILFDDKQHINSFNNINLRNGGNNNCRSRIVDPLISKLATNTHNDIMSYEPAIVYLNGDYWGVYGIREKMDEQYIEDNHTIDSDSIDLIIDKHWGHKVFAGSGMDFIDTYHTLMHTDPNATNFFTVLEDNFDVENLIDYFIVQTYIGNRDWLKNGASNQKLWKPQSNNGKWRYLLYDTDVSLQMRHDVDRDSFNDALYPDHENKHSDLFMRFLQNNDFQCLFGKRYTDLINTIFHTDTLASYLNVLQDNLEYAMPHHIERWNCPDSLHNWHQFIDDIKTYNSQRAYHIINYLTQYLNLPTSIYLGLNVIPQNSGKIMLNTIIPANYPWSGVMLNNNCTSSLTALSDSGYVFSHWTSNPQIGTQIHNSSLELYISQDDTLVANFRECSVSNLSISLDTINNAFSSLFDIGYGPYQYQWFLDSVPIEGINDSIFYPLKTGYYSVLITDKDSCSSLSNPCFFDCNLLLEPLLTQDTITNSLHINCLGGTQPYSYQWFYNNDTIINLYDTIHYPLETGYYYFLSTDINGCQSLSDSLFTEDCGSVMDPVLLQDSIDNSLHISCIGGTQPYSYQWFYNNDSILDFEDIIYYPLESGYYYFLSTDINGCQSLSDSLFTEDCGSVMAPVLLQDSIDNSLHISCIGGTQPYSYQWIYNNDIFLDLYDTIHYPLETGYYYFLATDINGCQSLSDSLFTEDCGSVMAPVLLQDSIDNSLHISCIGGTQPYSYQWIYNNDILLDLYDTIHYPLETGYYYFLATDINGCQSLSDSLFTEDCGSVMAPVLLQDSIDNSLHISCIGGTQPYSYQWIYNNDILLDLYDTIHYPLETGYYYFLATDINGCQSLSDSLFTEDCGSVMAPVLLQDSIDNSLHISCIGGTQPYSYQWFIDSVFIEGIDKSLLNIYSYGRYYVIIEDINGCRSFTDTISNKKLEVTIFPNPTNGLMNLQFIRLYGEKYTISVFDLHMNILHSIELPKTDHNMFYTHTFNLDINRTGLYLIRLESSKHQIAKRFIYIE